MDEPLQEEQLVQNTENKHNQFLPFIFHKKLAIPIFVGLFFLAFGVGAFYVGKQSTQTLILPSATPSPVTVFTQPTPTNGQTPTNIQSCQSDTDCYLTYRSDCLSDRIMCGVDDYSSSTVEAFNASLCVKKNTSNGVPGCAAQEQNINEYVAKCINNNCKKVKKSDTKLQSTCGNGICEKTERNYADDLFCPDDCLDRNMIP